MRDIFYTICPPAWDDSADKDTELILCNYHGVMLYAADLGKGRYEVERIISSEPKDFCRKDLAPGKIIKI